MNELHIVLSSNERYMPGATVALASVALNAKPETALCFHVFTEEVKPETFEFLEATLLRLHPKSVVEQHVCDESILSGLPSYAGSRMCWVRCFYSRILKDVDWALYVDCDVLYLSSPEEHFHTPTTLPMHALRETCRRMLRRKTRFGQNGNVE